MKGENAFYTKEYQDFRKTFDYIFTDKYKHDDIEEKILLDGKYIVKIHYYSDDSHEVFEYNVCSSKYELYKHGVKVAEYKNIDHHIDFFSTVEHSNGNNYLFFSVDLYGYSIMDLSNYNVYHFVPKESFVDKEETFIWTNILYCKVNNIIAVDGCYWACPSSTDVTGK